MSNDVLIGYLADLCFCGYVFGLVLRARASSSPLTTSSLKVKALPKSRSETC